MPRREARPPLPPQWPRPWSGVRPRCGIGFGLSLAQWFLPRSRVVPDLHWEITWHPSLKAWSAHYKGENGKLLQQRFFVRALSYSRSFLDHAAGGNGGQGRAAARRAAYAAAVRFWNEADRSKRDRLELAESGPWGFCGIRAHAAQQHPQ